MDELIRDVAIDAKVGEAEVARVLRSLGLVIGLAIQRGIAAVAVPDVGSFHLSRRAPRRFNNPANGKIYRTPARKSVHFRPDRRLLTIVNIETPTV